jgi:cysteine desulfurase
VSSSERAIYVDHAATTRPAAEVVEAMRPYFEERFGNASSVHGRGEAAREAIEVARERVADLIDAAPEEVVFTASGSEANNLALQGAMHLATAERARLVVSAIEHPSVLETARHLATQGMAVTVVPVGADGVVNLERLRAALGPDVALLSVMLVNNETGVIQPIEQVATLAHAAGARLHVDAVQAIGKLPVSMTALGADLLTLAGHKFHGPLGAAALIVRRRTRLMPLVHGGHQERSRRAGTENLPGIVGLGVAAARAATRLGPELQRIESLGDRLLAGLEAEVPGTWLHGDRERRVRSVVNVGFEGVDGEAVLHELDLAGITVSTGSACSAASPGPSHVLVAMGRSAEEAHASVRFSLGEANQDQDVETIVRETRSVIARLRALSAPAPRPMERSA